MSVKMKLIQTEIVPTYDWAIRFYITFPYLITLSIFTVLQCQETVKKTCLKDDPKSQRQLQTNSVISIDGHCPVGQAFYNLL